MRAFTLHTDNGLDGHMNLPRAVNTSRDRIAKLVEENQSVFINLVRTRQLEETILPFASYVPLPRTISELFKNVVDRGGTFSLG